MNASALTCTLAAALALAAGPALAEPAKAGAPAKPAAAAKPAEPATCTGTLSGAFKGTFTCVAISRDLGDGTSLIELKLKEAVEGVGAFFPGAWIIPGVPAKGTYPFDALGSGRSSLIVEEGGTLYSAQKTSSDRGDVTIVLSAVKASKATPATWEVHGSLRATLLAAASRRTDQIVVEARF